MFQRLNLILAIIMISLSVWMYKSSVNPSIIHLFPLLIGIILLALNNGIKEGAKEQTKVAGIFALIISITSMWLYWSPNPYSEEDFGVYIVITGMLSLAAFVAFIRRKKR